jgi:hypothetical protein
VYLSRGIFRRFGMKKTNTQSEAKYPIVNKLILPFVDNAPEVWRRSPSKSEL